MRLEGKIKMGYYPTPKSISERIKPFLNFPKEYTVLDPCCGEGDALLDIIDRNGKTYGVELDWLRYEKASIKNITRILHSGYEELKAPYNAFSILFLNPPYDIDENGERKEIIFLKDTIKYLTVGGILIYIIPEYILNKAIKILNYRFDELRIYRFTEKEYQDYKQIIVFGVKKHPSKLSPVKEEGTCKNIDEIPLLENPVYNVPSTKEPKYFNNDEVDMLFIKKEIEKSTIYKQIAQKFTQTKQEIKQPPLPLHMAHIGLLLATGNLNGEMDGHVVKGVVEKIKTETKEINENKEEEIKIKEEIKVSINILMKDGNLKKLI